MLDDGQSLVVTVTGQYEEAAAVSRAGWVKGAELTATGLADEGEWTDEVYAAHAADQAEAKDAGRAGAWRGEPRQADAGRAYAGLAHSELAGETGEADGPGLAARDGDGTLLPFYLDPMPRSSSSSRSIWCRPWLVDPSATRPLPRTPEIARGALEVTGAYHGLERFEADQEYRDLLSARVAGHMKVLRRKIADRGWPQPTSGSRTRWRSGS